MSFNKYVTLESLDDSKSDWLIRVRAQAIWPGISREKKEFRGFNIIFIDDCNHRIHAFIATQLCPKYKSDLEEGAIYTLYDFTVKYYSGSETYRAIRSTKHIFFTSDTQLIKDSDNGLKIQPQSFDLFCLEDVDKLKMDNRFLMDVVGLIVDIPTKIVYKKDDGDKFNVKFTITNGRCYVNVTFFNDFGENLLNTVKQSSENPIIIIIASAKISQWNDEVTLTNYPATRFYLNHQHSSVKKIRKRLLDCTFYNMDFEMEERPEVTVPLVNVKDLRSLSEEYIQKQVQCRVTVKKVDQKMNWYCNYCIKCDVDLEELNGTFKCPKCGKMKPYPDKRYQLSTLCSDHTGTIPIVWKDEEIIHLTGKTVYDIIADETQVGDGDQFPPLLKQFEKKCYNITITVTEDNVKEGSNVYMADKISDPQEISASHSPNKNVAMEIKQTEISNSQATDAAKTSPPTGTSTNKCRARKNTDVIPYDKTKKSEAGKFKNVKIEDP